MTTTLETQTTYKGWTNYETWNVAEWIMNTEDLYDIASLCDDYQDMVDSIENFITKTPDGVSFTSDNLDTQALDNLIDTINLVARKIQQWSESFGYSLLSYEYKLGTSQFTTLFFVIMSKSLMVSLLSKANTGSELIEILNTLVDTDTDTQEVNTPTLDVIEF